jgi:hypothetical protein
MRPEEPSLGLLLRLLLCDLAGLGVFSGGSSTVGIG